MGEWPVLSEGQGKGRLRSHLQSEVWALEAWAVAVSLQPDVRS